MNIKPLYRYLIEIGGKENTSETWAELAHRFNYAPHLEPERATKLARQKWFDFQKTQTYAKARELILKEVKTNADGEVISQRFVRLPKETQVPEGLELHGVSRNTMTGGGWDIYRKAKPGEVTRDDFRAVATEIAAKPALKIAAPSATAVIDGHVQVLALGDVHIGLSNSSDPIFAGLEWTPEELDKRTEILLSHLDSSASKVHLVFGGDITDGLDGMTARRGHTMPQNLDNRGQLRKATEWAVGILDAAVQLCFCEIEVDWLCESNHNPILDYAVGLTLETLAPQRWGGRVKVKLQESFIAPYSIAGRSLLATHGYDSKHMKHGWPRYLQPQHQQFVERVIEHNYCVRPILVRFDRHQYHDIGHSRFRDLLCPAFSLPSGWAQINFAADSRGGFLKIKFERDGRISPVLVEF